MWVKNIVGFSSFSPVRQSVSRSLWELDVQDHTLEAEPSDVIKNFKAKIQDRGASHLASGIWFLWLNSWRIAILGLHYPEKSTLTLVFCLSDGIIEPVQKYNLDRMVWPKCFPCLYPHAVKCNKPHQKPINTKVASCSSSMALGSLKKKKGL